jgi:hypothetical protein
MNFENIEIGLTNSRGRYVITGIVNGREVKAYTTDSEAYDYLNSDDPERSRDAMHHCMWKLQEVYDSITGYCSGC